MLQDTIERIHVGISKERESSTGQYADLSKGLYLVRGENVVLLGEVVRTHLSISTYSSKLIPMSQSHRIWIVKTMPSLAVSCVPSIRFLTLRNVNIKLLWNSPRPKRRFSLIIVDSVKKVMRVIGIDHHQQGFRVCLHASQHPHASEEPFVRSFACFL